jgi:hypothetical protein
MGGFQRTNAGIWSSSDSSEAPPACSPPRSRRPRRPTSATSSGSRARRPTRSRPHDHRHADRRHVQAVLQERLDGEHRLQRDLRAVQAALEAISTIGTGNVVCHRRPAPRLAGHAHLPGPARGLQPADDHVTTARSPAARRPRSRSPRPRPASASTTRSGRGSTSGAPRTASTRR